MNLEEDIKLEKIDVNPSNHPISIYRLIIGLNKIWSKEEAIEKKQQIISWQKDSEKLKRAEQIISLIRKDKSEYIIAITDMTKELSETKAKYDRLVRKIEDKIKNIHEQIKVAEREDYADIDDYCMKLRIKELSSLMD